MPDESSLASASAVTFRQLNGGMQRRAALLRPFAAKCIGGIIYGVGVPCQCLSDPQGAPAFWPSMQCWPLAISAAAGAAPITPARPRSDACMRCGSQRRSRACPAFHDVRLDCPTEVWTGASSARCHRNWSRPASAQCRGYRGQLQQRLGRRIGQDAGRGPRALPRG